MHQNTLKHNSLLHLNVKIIYMNRIKCHCDCYYDYAKKPSTTLTSSKPQNKLLMKLTILKHGQGHRQVFNYRQNWRRCPRVGAQSNPSAHRKKSRTEKAAVEIFGRRYSVECHA